MLHFRNQWIYRMDCALPGFLIGRLLLAFRSGSLRCSELHTVFVLIMERMLVHGVPLAHRSHYRSIQAAYRFGLNANGRAAHLVGKYNRHGDRLCTGTEPEFWATQRLTLSAAVL
jgi:hypothetical protein